MPYCRARSLCRSKPGAVVVLCKMCNISVRLCLHACIMTWWAQSRWNSEPANCCHKAEPNRAGMFRLRAPRVDRVRDASDGRTDDGVTRYDTMCHSRGLRFGSVQRSMECSTLTRKKIDYGISETEHKTNYLTKSILRTLPRWFGSGLSGLIDGHWPGTNCTVRLHGTVCQHPVACTPETNGQNENWTLLVERIRNFRRNRAADCFVQSGQILHCHRAEACCALIRVF